MIHILTETLQLLEANKHNFFQCVECDKIVVKRQHLYKKFCNKECHRKNAKRHGVTRRYRREHGKDPSPC